MLRMEAAQAILSEAAAAAGAGLPDGEAAAAAVAGSATSAAAALGAGDGPPRCPAWASPLDLEPLVGEVHAAGGSAATKAGGRPGSAGGGGGGGGAGAGALDLKWWDWGTTDAQQKKGWSMSEAQQILSRCVHSKCMASAQQ